MSDQEIVNTSSQYSYPLHNRTDDQEYIQVNKLDYLRLLCKAYLHSGSSASKCTIQRHNDLYELLQTPSHDSEELYQEIDSSFIRDQIYSYARTYGLDEDTATYEDLRQPETSYEIQLPTRRAYRTVSHLGFLSPQANRKPIDYHIPSYKSYYKPLSRELSIEELFTSNKYVNLSDECIRIIVKNKLATFNDFKQSMQTRRKFSTVPECRESDEENPFKKLYAEESNGFVDTIQHECPMTHRSCPDLPTSSTQNVDRFVDTDKETYAPLAHSEYSDYGTQSENERLLSRATQSQYFTSNNAQQHISSLFDQRLHALKRHQLDRKISHYNITLNINKKAENRSSECNDQIQDVLAQSAPNIILEDVTNKPRLSTSLPFEREKKLLSRSVRNERKKEFTEIWMNHLHSRRAQCDNGNSSDDRISPYADMDLDPMEEEIISKIDENHLDKDDESIFTKIKTVIIERSINKKKMSSNEDLDNLDVSSSFSTSTPKVCKELQFDEVSLSSSAGSAKSSTSNHTFLMDEARAQRSSGSDRSQHSSKNKLISEITIAVNPIDKPLDIHQAQGDTKRPKANGKVGKAKRNFIVENIRNASQRKRAPKNTRPPKPTNRSNSAPRLHVDDLRSQRHNAIFDQRRFESETASSCHATTSNESTDGDSITIDLETACQDLIDFIDSSKKKEAEKFDELSESVADLKNVVERCEEQVSCLFLEKMEKEIDEIFNLHTEIHNDNAEHKEKVENKLREDAERLKQLDFDVNNIQSD